MRKAILPFLLATALALSGCNTAGQLPSTVPSLQEQTLIAAEVALAPKPDRPEILLAVTMEIGARFRCPVAGLGAELLFSARLSYDLLVRPRITDASNAIVDRLRAATNLACSLQVVPAVVPAAS